MLVLAELPPARDAPGKVGMRKEGWGRVDEPPAAHMGWGENWLIPQEAALK